MLARLELGIKLRLLVIDRSLARDIKRYMPVAYQVTCSWTRKQRSLHLTKDLF